MENEISLSHYVEDKFGTGSDMVMRSSDANGANITMRRSKANDRVHAVQVPLLENNRKVGNKHHIIY